MGLTIPSRPVPIERPRPRAKRRKGLNALSDLEAWSYSEKEILDAARESWRSAAYAHYSARVVRYFDALGEPWRLAISFDCKYNHPNHNSLERDRLRTSDGTSNLLNTALACDRRRGAIQLANDGSNQPQPWTAARHYAMLAIRCARDHRPFASVVDPLHAEEVRMLRPGTLLPTAASISNYVRYIYEGASHDAGLYLRDLPGALHLAVDGWTCPTSTSYLGIVVFWEEDRVMWRVVLEFVRLTKAHTGDYMAEQIEDCLERYGIKHKVLTLCADNASNNNTLVRGLATRLPSFRGPQDRIRCIAHIFNLMCKAFTSLLLTSSGQSNATASADDDELSLVLEIFKEPTDRMSQSGVPLVSEVVPELLTARDRLYDVRDDTFNQGLHPVVRVAAEASLLIFEKYMGLTLEESDVHVIAIVMCPDRKLKWYTDRGYEVDSIRSRVVSRFGELYPDTTQEAQSGNE